MTSILRTLSALTLALVLTLTAQSMALARGKTMVAGEMVLCTGTGVVTVQVDAEGNPVAPSHICPDCALTLLMSLAAAPAEAQAVRAAKALVFSAVSTRVRGGTAITGKARDPPGMSGNIPA